MNEISQPLAVLLTNISNFVLLAGAVLVLAGTWGAVKFGEIKERYADERITANEARTATANAEAEVAKADAARANERAASLEKEAAEARVRQGELRESNLALSKQIDKQRDAALALGQSVEALQPRRLTADQKDRLWSTLEGAVPPGLAVSVSVDGSCSDCGEYSQDFVHVLSRDPSIQIGGGVQFTTGVNIPKSGIRLSAKTDEQLKLFSSALRDASIDFDVGQKLPEDNPLGDVMIFVSRRSN